MKQEQDVVRRLVHDIFTTPASEIHCDMAGELMARFVTAHIPDAEARQLYPQLWRHFQVCDDCAAQYELMRELERQYGTEAWPHLESVPPPPAWETPHSQGASQGTIVRFPSLGLRPVRSGFEGQPPATVAVEFDEGNVTLAFDVTPSQEQADQLDLLCTASAREEALQTALEGATVWLQQDDAGAVIREEALDELGDVSFLGIPPARYSLQLFLGEQVYTVRGIDVLE